MKMTKKNQSWVAGGLIILVAGAGSIILARRMQAKRRNKAEMEDRWHVVTVNRSLAEVAPDGNLPEPLAKLGGTIEVQLRPAPGERGTEITARISESPQGKGSKNAHQNLREALRDTKSLLETGEILRPDRPPSTKRTLSGLPIDLATQRAKREGRL